MTRFIGFLALAGFALISVVGTVPAHAAALGGTQTAQARPATQPALPADIGARITAAIKSGDPQALAATISALITADPDLANAIVMFAVAQAPNAAPTIAVAAAKAVQALGGDPTQVTLAVIAALEAQVQPTAGGAGGGLTDTEVASLVRTVVASVSDAVTLSASQVAALGSSPVVNQFSQYSPPTVNLPPASPH